MGNPRAEAAARVPGHDVRVLEPSPPAVHDVPLYADDPVAGGDVVPVERPGARSWESACVLRNDPALHDWCAQRWLVRRPLDPLPATFATTVAALHALAEQGGGGPTGVRAHGPGRCSAGDSSTRDPVTGEQSLLR